ncbi:MAG: DUF89 family protein [Pontiellaceae bacterium]|nr:DUF89 family protein [Pontiellaceae bacterium]MBN2783316.1 DUF89 family protein [Pontiellaceae bacterium]
MQSYTECIPCFVRQAFDALCMVGSDERQRHRVLQRVLVEAARFPLDRPPPAMAQEIHRIIREELQNADPYAKIKDASTRIALDLAEEARGLIKASIEPFRMAVRFAIAGNIMDFALASAWDRLDLNNFIEKTRLYPLDDAAVGRLHRAVDAAQSILVLGDNCGETVFDRLLIEQMAGKRIHYAVKGAPVINDATLADAIAAGLDQVAELVENGSDAPGTLLEDCSEAFCELFDSVDLVIAKGQANYESLNSVARPVFFLTQVKCPVIGRDLDEPVGRWVIREHKGAGR